MAITISGSGITSANIADGTIVDADINSSAAIAASKLTGTGKVLQVVYVNPSSASQVTHAGAMSELTTTLRLTITPKVSDSYLYCIFDGFFNSPNTTALYYGKFYDVTAGASPNIPPSYGSRDRVDWAMRVSPDDANDLHMMHMESIFSSASTTARTYTIHVRSEAGVQTFFGSPLSTASGVSTKPKFIIMEIAQ